MYSGDRSGPIRVICGAAAEGEGIAVTIGQVFHEPRLEDRRWIAGYLGGWPELGCEFTFGNIFSHVATCEVSVGEFGGCFVYRQHAPDRPEYSFPLGRVDPGTVIDFIIKDAADLGHDAAFFALNNEHVERLEGIRPGIFDVTLSRDHFDYIYRRQDLADLPGTKYQKKRNHVRRFFRENPSASYETITSGNVGECLDMTHRWLAMNSTAEDSDELAAEGETIERAFAHFEELGFSGGLLRLNGEVIAYAAGEPMSVDTFCIHFEKALSTVHGGYAAINQQMAAHHLSDYEFVNREDDLGNQNLRKAKLSYKPYRLLEKSSAVLKG